MSQSTEGVRPRPDVIDATGKLDVAAAHDRLAGWDGLRRSLERMEEEARLLVEGLERASVDADHARMAAREDLVLAVLAAAPRRELPDNYEWHHSLAPLWTHREGGRIYLLLPRTDCDEPRPGREIAKTLTVVVLDEAQVGSA